MRKRRGTRRGHADAWPSAWAKSSGAQGKPLGHNRRFCPPYQSCRGIKYRRFTGDARRREGCRRRCAALAPRCLRARRLCRARLLSALQLDHPLLEVGRPLDGSDGGYQIHDLSGLTGRQDAAGAGGDDRLRGLGQVAGARDLRQLEDDRAIAPRRQDEPDTKAQRSRIARQGLGDERAHQRLRRALKHGLKCERGLVRDPFGRPRRRPPEGGAHDFSPHIGIAGIAIVGSSRFGRVAGCRKLPDAVAYGGRQRSGLPRTAMIRSSQAPFYHLQKRCQYRFCRSRVANASDRDRTLLGVGWGGLPAVQERPARSVMCPEPPLIGHSAPDSC